MTDGALELAALPVPSTEIDEVSLWHSKGAVGLRLEYGDDEPRIGELRFERSRAHRHLAESHCSAWHLVAYDRLVEVEASPWVAELIEAMPADMRDLFEMHHYMIYFDSFGCYEVVAKSWSMAAVDAESNGCADA